MNSAFDTLGPYSYLSWLNHSPTAREERYTLSDALALLQEKFPGPYTLVWDALPKNTLMCFKFFNQEEEVTFRLTWLCP